MPRGVKTTTRVVDKLNAIKKENFVDLYKQTHGHITDCCRAIEISRTTYYTWLEKDEKFAKAIMEAEMDLNDDIRDVLVKKAGEGDMTAVIFYLKNRHPDFKQQSQTNVQVNILNNLQKEKDEFGL